MTKSAMSSVVAVSLLLVIAVISVVGFQSWFNTFSTETLSRVESQGSGDVIASGVKTVVGNQLYFNNGYNENLVVSRVTIGGNDCNFSGSLSSGLQNLTLSNNCTSGLSSAVSEVVIYTAKGIFSSKMKVGEMSGNQGLSEDLTPDSFLFSSATGVDFSAIVVSETLLPSGFNVVLPINVSGEGNPQISINGGDWVTQGEITLGDNITIRLNSSSLVLTSYVANISLGDYSTLWVVTTRNYTFSYPVGTFEDAFVGENIPGWTMSMAGVDSYFTISQSAIWASNGTYSAQAYLDANNGNEHWYKYTKTYNLTNVSKILFDVRVDSWSSYGYTGGTMPFIRLDFDVEGDLGFKRIHISDPLNGSSVSMAYFINQEIDVSNTTGEFPISFMFHGRNSVATYRIDNIRFLG